MAADSQQQRHIPGTLKQQNKIHKHGKHKSKGQLDKDTKGRVNVKTFTKKNKQVQRKQDRKHHAEQIRKQKREEILAKKRNRGSSNSPPHFVVLLPLHRDLNLVAALDVLKSCDDTATVRENEQGVVHISIPRFKQRIAIYIPESGNLQAVLDATKVADSLLCLLSPEGGIDDFGEHLLTCLFGQGLPSVTFAVQGFKQLPVKKQNEARKLLLRNLEKRFPSDKFHTLDSDQDGLLILRQITSHKLKPILFRERRPHLLAENIEFELEHEQSESGTLKITGYLRGKNLSVNSLIHLPGWGDFQMTQIDAAKDPYPLYCRTEKHKNDGSKIKDVEMEEEDESRVLEKADPKLQQSLQSEVIPDEMDGEQTWPTEDELAEAEQNAKKKIQKRVPKGTSDYQASWIVDSEEEDSLDEDEEDVDMAVDDEESGEESEEDNEEYETLTVTEADDAAKYDDTIDMDEEQKLFEKLKEEKSHVMFPDEIDTPKDKTARSRFQRYRGLKSFRTSPWDPKENLPADYARIFQFKNFKQTKKRVFSQEDDGGVLSGWYITVHIAQVPKAFMESYKPGTPVVMFGLLPHEQKISVVNFLVKRCSDFRAPVKSKERLVFHVGFRRYSTCPIFSQHTNGSKHKFERFLPHDTVTMATVFAPITFPPIPVLVFQEQTNGQHQLVALGSVHSVNPGRVVVKRIVLSGFPFKINKRSAVIRYMFFNREDIMWFKPVELKTKWGRRGHIREPLGTHGHMKCIFDGQLKSQDTVLMNLFKRVFPKWTYNSYVSNPPPFTEASTGDMDAEYGVAYEMFE